MFNEESALTYALHIHREGKENIVRCPHCESSNTKSFSMVYDLFSSDYESNLALKCSPPNEPTPGIFFGIVFTILSLLAALNIAKFRFFDSYWIVFLVTLVFSFAALVFIWHLTIGKALFTVYDKKLAKWRESWLCMQCNTNFRTNSLALNGIN